MFNKESNFDPYTFLIRNDFDPYKIFGRDLCTHIESYLGVEKCSLTVIPLGNAGSNTQTSEEKSLNPALETRVIYEKKNFFKDIGTYLDVIVCHSYDQPHFRKGVYFWLNEDQSFIVYNNTSARTEFVEYSGEDWNEGLSLNEWFKL